MRINFSNRTYQSLRSLLIIVSLLIVSAPSFANCPDFKVSYETCDVEMQPGFEQFSSILTRSNMRVEVSGEEKSPSFKMTYVNSLGNQALDEFKADAIKYPMRASIPGLGDYSYDFTASCKGGVLSIKKDMKIESGVNTELNNMSLNDDGMLIIEYIVGGSLIGMAKCQ